MSKELELLKKIIKNMQYLHYECNKDLRDEIQELLNQPEQDPLSEQQVFHHWLYLEEVSPYLNFTAGVRYAEQQHGIGE